METTTTCERHQIRFVDGTGCCACSAEYGTQPHVLHEVGNPCCIALGCEPECPTLTERLARQAAAQRNVQRGLRKAGVCGGRGRR